MMKTYLIASPGRTGSVFLLNYLKKTFSILQINDQIEFTHDATLQLPENTIVICARRRDLWRQTLSAVIAQYTNEWTRYSDSSDIFEIAPEDFENKYVWNLRWFDAFNHYTNYSKKIDLYFEDFIQQPSHINLTLSFPHINIDLTSESSPYRETKIKNLDTIKNLFVQLEKNVHLHNFPVEERNWSFPKYV
jgi:hypothetical protein